MASINRGKGLSSDYVYEALMDKIINLEWLPGQAISEKEVAEWLGVSRTPIRDAISKLVAQELVDVYPQRGTYVALIDLELVDEVRFGRRVLEEAILVEATKDFPTDKLFELESTLSLSTLAIRKEMYKEFFDYDETFHRILFEGCKKPHLWKNTYELNAQFRRLRMLCLLEKEEYIWHKIEEEHQQIIQAISEHNEALARTVMDNHLNPSKNPYENLLIKYPQYFKASSGS